MPNGLGGETIEWQMGLLLLFCMQNEMKTYLLSLLSLFLLM